MNVQTIIPATLEKELTPKEVIELQYGESVELLKTRAPELVKQYEKNQTYILELTKIIESLEIYPLIPTQQPETPYPTEALLGMSEAVYSISSKLSMPPALVGQCALGLVNAITQGLVNLLKPSNPKPEPTSLYLLIGADSGEGKSLADKILSYKLSLNATDNDLVYRNQLNDYELAKKAYHAQQEVIKRNKNLNQTDREQQLQDLTQPQVPMNPRYKISDTTMQGVARQFNNGCTRLSISTDEGGSFWGGFAMVNNQRAGVMAGFNAIWTDGSWEFDRGAIENSYMLVGRRLAISMSIQNKLLQDVMLDKLAMEQGFLGRHLIAAPDSRIAERQMVKIDWHKEMAVVEFWNKLNYIYDIKLTTRNDQPLVLEPKNLTLSEEAESIYMDFGNKCFALHPKEQYQPFKPMIAKAEANLLRVAATLTCFNKPSAEIIDKDTMEASVHLMNYYLKEAARITQSCQYSADTDNTDLSLAAELLTWLKSTKRYLTYSTDLSQKAPYKTRNKAVLEKLMGILVVYGHAYKLATDTIVEGKPRKNVWLITS